MQNDQFKRVETTSTEELKGYKNLQVMDLTDLLQEDFIEMVKGREELQGYELEFTSTKEIDENEFVFYPTDWVVSQSWGLIENILNNNVDEIKSHYSFSRAFPRVFGSLVKTMTRDIMSAIEDSGVKEVSKVTIISAPQDTILTVGTEGKPVYVQVVIGEDEEGHTKAVIQTEMSFKVEVNI